MDKETKEKHITSDISSFDKEVPIYKILFQDRTTALLKYIIDKIAIDKYEHVNFRLPSIVIAGKEGKQLIARAFSNSLCYHFEHIQGQHLGMGGCAGSVYKDSDTETVYYISSADRLSPYSVSLLHNFLTHGHIKFRDNMRDELVTVTTHNKLFVLGVHDPKKLCPDLYKAGDYRCYLKNYSTSEMEILVDQRLKWCGIDHQKEVPAIIVRNGEGSIANCIRLLSVCYLVMRGDYRTKMMISDIETGIALNKQEAQVPAPF